MKRLGLITAIMAVTLSVTAKEYEPLFSQKDADKNKTNQSSSNKLMKYASDCEPSSAQADLDINNVRTRILNGGDMWWDLSNARYEIPKLKDLNGVRKNSIFAGAIWIGGEDEGVLKLAAMTYRQSGSDFWPGPLDTKTATTNANRCKSYDQIYSVTREEIEKHVSAFESGTLTTISPSIKNWPGNGKTLNDPQYLAPYFDQDGAGSDYEPENGDYPVLQTECRGVPILAEKNGAADQPDQMLWFVYNDRGNIHSETQGQAIGMELQTTAFAYATNDELNNMTFYSTRIINRGNTKLSKTYFGQWVDADLGNYADDYVGCDVGLSLGYCYNGDDDDEGILGYGLNPPSVGVDFFEGPKRDTTINGIDTFVELGMSKFVYYNNDSRSNFGDPQQPIHYYNYLRGLWKNGDCLKYGGNGQAGTVCADYMFPGVSDPENPTDWTEKIAGNAPADRRFLQTSGPFTLKPGAVNKITVGIVWARTSSGGATGSLALLKSSSRKAQELFDNCFDLLDGPDAPFVEVRELNNEAIFMFSDTKRIEAYEEVTITDGVPNIYKFEGYRIFQLKNSTVGTGDLGDIDKAREIFICDLQNNITRLVNQPFDEVLGQPLPKLMVDGPDKGLVHSLSVTEDAFATGSNKKLVNNKTYYFLVMSYSALPKHPSLEYLAGRRIRQFSVTPNSPEAREGGLKLNGQYGDGPKLVRLEGRGNGGMYLELTDESKAEIMANGSMKNPQYKIGKGPVNIKIVDPLKVPQGEFELILQENPVPIKLLIRERLLGVKAANTRWILINKTTNDTIFSERTIDQLNEQLITEQTTGSSLKDWGMAVTVLQVAHPGDRSDLENGLIGWSVNWADNSKQWLTAIQDQDNGFWFNWIRSGRVGGTATARDYSVHDYFIGNDAVDQFEIYEKIWGGRIGPYRLASRNILPGEATPIERPFTLVQGVAYNGIHPDADWHSLSNLSSVDIVLTRDKSKWSKCLVLEMGESAELNEGGAKKFDVRKHNSINKDGTENTAEQGRTWFPGYAINIETGERLNIILGEDSYQGLNNGRDLLWNPTDQGGQYSSGYAGFGGRHYIYVMDTDSSSKSTYSEGPKYDECNYYTSVLAGATAATYSSVLNNKVLFHAMWVIPSYMANGYKMDKDENGMPMPPSDVSFSLRVKKPYQYFITDLASNNSYNPRYSFSTAAVYTERGAEFGKAALSTIRLVPNPYFAYSEYENNPVENKVKITNLPKTCKISIYTMDGSLVRRIVKDDESTELVWDLKNNARVPIASGTYIIHVDAGALGEYTLKWLGIMRELDLDSF